MAANTHEAKTHSSKLHDHASHGEVVVISKSGVPIAGLVGTDRYKPTRDLGFATGTFTMSSIEYFNAPLDPDTLALFNGESGCGNSSSAHVSFSVR
jgi:prevent-host-death family protein